MRDRYRLRPAVHLELGEDALEMCTHRLWADTSSLAISFCESPSASIRSTCRSRGVSLSLDGVRNRRSERVRPRGGRRGGCGRAAHLASNGLTRSVVSTQEQPGHAVEVVSLHAGDEDDRKRFAERVSKLPA